MINGLMIKLEEDGNETRDFSLEQQQIDLNIPGFQARGGQGHFETFGVPANMYNMESHDTPSNTTCTPINGYPCFAAGNIAQEGTGITYLNPISSNPAKGYTTCENCMVVNSFIFDLNGPKWHPSFDWSLTFAFPSISSYPIIAAELTSEQQDAISNQFNYLLSNLNDAYSQQKDRLFSCPNEILKQRYIYSQKGRVVLQWKQSLDKLREWKMKFVKYCPENICDILTYCVDIENQQDPICPQPSTIE